MKADQSWQLSTHGLVNTIYTLKQEMDVINRNIGQVTALISYVLYL